MSLDDLSTIIDKYVAAGKQKILKDEMAAFAQAILEAFEISGAPQLVKVDDTAVRVEAGADSPARLLMSGFPNVLHPKLFVTGGFTDGRYRENTTNVSMDFDLASNLWGTEKASQWYMIYALAGDADTEFTIKAMPWLRVKSQAGQVISLGTNLIPATGIGYGFTTDELVGFNLYVVSGASKGLMRSITANNNDNGTGGTITYGGSALSLAEGDWFAILPATNFLRLEDIFNDASSNISAFGDIINRNIIKLTFYQASYIEFTDLLPGRYKLIIRALQNTNYSPDYAIRFNSDTGNNYQWELIYSYQDIYGSQYSTIDNLIKTTTLINPPYPGCETLAEILFSTWQSNPTKVLVNANLSYYRNDIKMVQTRVAGIYQGAAPLNSLKFITSTGTLTGDAILTKID